MPEGTDTILGPHVERESSSLLPVSSEVYDDSVEQVVEGGTIEVSPPKHYRVDLPRIRISISGPSVKMTRSAVNFRSAFIVVSLVRW